MFSNCGNIHKNTESKLFFFFISNCVLISLLFCMLYFQLQNESDMLTNKMKLVSYH